MSAWDLALQLEAYRRQRAVPRVGRQQQIVDPQAKILTPLAMAGWDPTLQAVALAGRKAGAEMLFCPDPREWELQLEMLSQLNTRIERWFEECYDDGDGDRFPQLILPSRATAKLLVGVAYRFAWLQVPSKGGRDLKRWYEGARRLGRYLLFFVQQMEIPGQQSVVIASQRLSAHFAIGQQPSGNLNTLLTWVNPPEGEDLMMAALEAEQTPLERTSVEFDEQLEKAIREYLKTRRTGGSFASFNRSKIDDALRSTLDPIIDATRRALTAVDELALKPLPALEQLQLRELRAFHGHMKHLRNDGRFSKVDKPRAAVRGLTILEDAGEQWNRALVWGDPVALAKARFTGEVLHGELVPVDVNVVAVRSRQEGLKIRRGDELVLMSDPTVTLLVEDIRSKGGYTYVKGTCACGLDEGAIVDFGPEPPSWHMLGISLGKVFRRLASQPDTHRPGSAAQVKVPPVPADYKPVDALAQWEKR